MIKLFIDSLAISSLKYCAQLRRKRTDKWNIRRWNRSFFYSFRNIINGIRMKLWNSRVRLHRPISATKEWPERETGKKIVHKLSAPHWFSILLPFIWRMIKIIVNRKCFKKSFNHFRYILIITTYQQNVFTLIITNGERVEVKIKLLHIANKLFSNLISIQSFWISEVPSPTIITPIR